MKPRNAKMDRLGISGVLGILILCLTVMAVLVLFVDYSYRSNIFYEESSSLVQILGLDNLSIVPSGRPLRNPIALNPAIHLGFVPELARIHPDPADLVLSMPVNFVSQR
jgi:hypothetical protein